MRRKGDLWLLAPGGVERCQCMIPGLALVGVVDCFGDVNIHVVCEGLSKDDIDTITHPWYEIS